MCVCVINADTMPGTNVLGSFLFAPHKVIDTVLCTENFCTQWTSFILQSEVDSSLLLAPCISCLLEHYHSQSHTIAHCH